MEHSIFYRVPEGHPIVARAIHRWGGQCTIIESHRDDRNVTAAAALRSSLWDSPNRCCPGFPVVNYWAIIESPSGTKNIACSVSNWSDLVSSQASQLAIYLVLDLVFRIVQGSYFRSQFFNTGFCIF